MTLNEQQIKMVNDILIKKGNISKTLRGDFLDHICCMIEERMDAGASFKEAMADAFTKLPVREIKDIETFTFKLLDMETSYSSRTSQLATIPFLFWGFTWLGSHSGIDLPPFISSFLFLLAVLSMFALFCYGWYKNFPNWSFPAIGFCIFFSLLFMNITIPAYSNEKLLFYAWIPFGISLFVCLMLKPSLEPVRKIVARIKADPTLILFILYGFAPFFISLFNDEIHSKWMIPVALVSTLLLSFGLYKYLRTDNVKIKLTYLIVSVALSSAITITASNLYWSNAINM